MYYNIAHLVAIIGEIGSPFDMKSTALFGMAQGKRHGFKDYVEPSKVSFVCGVDQIAYSQAMDSVLNACGKLPAPIGYSS